MVNVRKSVVALVRLCLASLLIVATPALAGELREGGKIPLTAGISSVDGAAGGGLATWALIAGDETRDGYGASAHVSDVPLRDFNLATYGAAVGLRDRVELSYAHQRFDTEKAGGALGLGRGYAFDQDVFGVKLKLTGDAVYDQDRALPQIAIGAQVRHATRTSVIHAIGGDHATGVDFYASATKILLAHSLVLDGTVRLTRANQFGLLGFGGDRQSSYTPQFEGSAGYLLSRKLLMGAELRTKPDNLSFARETKAWDLFAAYSPVHHLTVTAAYVDLGPIATFRHQHGAFLSAQASF